MRWRLLKLDLPYLIGELIIVILGVTIALAAEQWRQSENDRELEDQYLSRLIEGIEGDIERWNSLLASVELKNDALDNARNWIQASNDSRTVRDRYLQDLTDGARMAFGAGIVAGRTTFEELISSGNFILIEDATLRESIAGYYGIIENQTRRISNRATNYQAAIYQLIPRDPEFTVHPDLSETDKERIIERSELLDIESLIIGERNFGRLEIEILNGLFSMAEQLLQELRYYQSGK
jgi:hypothetical protein